MNLKKIYEPLNLALEELSYIEASPMLQESFSKVKSGVDVCIIESEKKTTVLDVCVHIIQKIQKALLQSPRVLLLVPDKETMLDFHENLTQCAKHTDLRFYGVHDKSNLDQDKNLISLGIDVLIGTPKRINEMFSGAGFDVNQLKLWIFYHLDSMLKNREESFLYRLNESIHKPQKLFFIQETSEKTDIFVENLSQDALWIEQPEN